MSVGIFITGKVEGWGISNDKPQESFNQYKFYQKYYKCEKSGSCRWGADAPEMGDGEIFFGWVTILEVDTAEIGWPQRRAKVGQGKWIGEGEEEARGFLEWDHGFGRRLGGG